MASGPGTASEGPDFGCEAASEASHGASHTKELTAAFFAGQSIILAILLGALFRVHRFLVTLCLSTIWCTADIFGLQEAARRLTKKEHNEARKGRGQYKRQSRGQMG